MTDQDRIRIVSNRSKLGAMLALAATSGLIGLCRAIDRPADTGTTDQPKARPSVPKVQIVEGAHTAPASAHSGERERARRLRQMARKESRHG